MALLGDQSGFRGARASFVHRWFTESDARQLYPEADHAHQSRAFVADLRAAAAGREGKDTEAASMISSLLGTSAEFAALWADHDVAFRRNDRKRLNHPALGLIEVNCLNLFSEDGRQRLLWFTPQSARTAPSSWTCSPSSVPRKSPDRHADSRPPRSGSTYPPRTGCEPYGLVRLLSDPAGVCPWSGSSRKWSWPLRPRT